MAEYKCSVEIDSETWAKADKEDKLVELVESAAYKAMWKAREDGHIGLIKDVYLNIVPNFAEDRTHEVVEVVIIHHDSSDVL